MTNNKTTTKKIYESLNGSGHKTWTVATEDEQGRWLHTERFDTLAEAEHWIKWA